MNCKTRAGLPDGYNLGAMMAKTHNLLMIFP